MKDFNQRKNGDYSNKKSFVNDIAPPSPQHWGVILITFLQIS